MSPDGLLLKEGGTYGYVSKALKEILARADEAYEICRECDCSGCPALYTGEIDCAIEDIREIARLGLSQEGS